MKLNVLHLIPSFHQGGSERQAVQLFRLLHEDGRYRVHLACLDGGGILRDEVESLGPGEIPEYPLTSFYDRNAAVQLRRLVQLLREREISIIQTHDFYTNIFGMAAAAVARVPGRIASKRETEMFRTGAQKMAERGAYRLAHRIVANADAVRRLLISEGVGPKKIVTVYNGLDLERMSARPDLRRDEACALFGLPHDEGSEPRRFVTLVANLRHEVKDHPTFLRAARRVREAVPGAAFIIAGEGPLMEPVRSLSVQLGIERDVFLTGRCAHVAELLALSEVCVLSSRAEGFSNSILEYMAAARAVVVTDVGGAREAVTEGETGFLVQAGDDLAMAERIISLLDDRERARAMGERGRRIVEQKFSCEAQLKNTLRLYDELLARSRSRLPRIVKSLGEKET